MVILTSTFLLTLQSLSNAALPTDGLYFEVRNTGGSDTNGGCYHIGGGSGVDYSNADSAEESGTDLAVDSGDLNRVYSATVNFNNSNFVDNCIMISDTGTSGNFLTGRYEVTAVGNDGDDYLDLDRNVATDTDTGGDWALGGALATIQEAVDDAVAGFTDIWVENDTYAETVTVGISGAATGYNRIIGYSTTRGDNPTSTSRFLITGSATRTNCINHSSSYNYWSYENMRCTAATDDGLVMANGNVYLINVSTYSNTGSGLDTGGFGRTPTLIGFEAYDNGADGISWGGNLNNSVTCYYCHLWENTGYGMQSGGLVNLYFSLADTNTNTGFYVGNGGILAMHNVSYGNTGVSTDGFSIAGSNRNFMINNDSNDNGDDGYERRFTTNADVFFANNNAEGNSGDPTVNLQTRWDVDNIESDPLYTDKANRDFSLSTSSPLIDAGYQNFPGSATDFKINIGIDQTQASAGGGGTRYYSGVN